MSVQHDVMKTLAEARPARLDPGHDGRRVDPSEIMSHPRAAVPGGTHRRTRRWALAVAVPAVAAAAVLVGFGGFDEASRTASREGGTHADGRTGTTNTDRLPASSRELFLAAADRNLAAAATGGRYWVLKAEHGEARTKGPANRPYDIMIRRYTEEWQPVRAGDATVVAGQYLGAAPITDADKAAWQADGAPTRWTESAPGMDPVVIDAAGEPKYARPIQNAPREATYPLGGGTVTVAQLAALPTDPAALKTALLALFRQQGVTETDDYSLFWTGAHLVSDLPVPAQLRAASYRMLADITGVTLLGPATDRHGRAGVAVGCTRTGDEGRGSQTRLIIDPKTGQALAQESWDVAAQKLTGYTLTLTATFTDETPPTDLPTRPARQ
jgi:hypothetical protein